MYVIQLKTYILINFQISVFKIIPCQVPYVNGRQLKFKVLIVNYAEIVKKSGVFIQQYSDEAPKVWYFRKLGSQG